MLCREVECQSVCQLHTGAVGQMDVKAEKKMHFMVWILLDRIQALTCGNKSDIKPDIGELRQLDQIDPDIVRSLFTLSKTFSTASCDMNLTSPHNLSS